MHSIAVCCGFDRSTHNIDDESVGLALTIALLDEGLCTNCQTLSVHVHGVLDPFMKAVPSPNLPFSFCSTWINTHIRVRHSDVVSYSSRFVLPIRGMMTQLRWGCVNG